MKMYERNPGQGRTALLIHPMLSSAEGIELCVTNFWGEGVHCFVPDLSGHGEDAAATYHSAAEEAKAIHDVLVEQGCTHLDLGFGASLGGVVLFEMLKFPDLTFDHVFFEGVSFYEKAPLIEFVLTRVFLSKHRKAVKDPELSPEMQKRCVFAYGEKDSDLKQCRKLLPKKYPGAALKVWPGYAHCGKMTAESQNYAAMLKQILES